MELENQVSSLELSKRLKELGVKHWMYITEDGDNTYWDRLNNGDGIEDPEIIHSDNLVNAASKMLIYLIEKGLVKP